MPDTCPNKKLQSSYFHLQDLTEFIHYVYREKLKCQYFLYLFFNVLRKLSFSVTMSITLSRTCEQFRFPIHVVLITGAGQGIGKCLALQFGEIGAKLALWDINEVYIYFELKIYFFPFTDLSSTVFIISS